MSDIGSVNGSGTPGTQPSTDPQLPPMWNSLEIAKLVMSSLTPIGLFVVGSMLTLASNQQALDREIAAVKAAEVRDTAARRQAEVATLYGKVVDKRTHLWDELAPKLNDIYVYFLYVGHWKKLTANEIVERKRETDKLIYTYRPFFSDGFFQAYTDFMEAGFSTYGGAREDAHLHTSELMRDGDDKTRFTGEDHRDQVHAAYYRILAAAATDLELTISTPRRPKGPND